MRSDQWRDRLGPWLLPILALAALGISAGALYQLMVRFGWTEWQAALLPTCVDLLALYGVYLWLSNTHGGEAWRFGRKVAYAALIVSLAGNALEHGLSATGWYTAGTVLFGSVPPVALFVMVHAYFKVRTTRPKPKLSTPLQEPATTNPGAAVTGVSRNPTRKATVTTEKTTPGSVTNRAGKPVDPVPEYVQVINDYMTAHGKEPTRSVFTELIRARGGSMNNLKFQASRYAVRAATQNGHKAP